jgi:NAD(P)-dependent dehydrogenase (short-subunit alcohol dehydrogenase family)
MSSMAGRVAIVTGSGTGIGRASAIAFAAAGARVLVADVNDDAGNETVALIEKDGGEAHFIHTDVTQAPAVEAMVQRAIDRFGRLDFAHNNAGMSGAPAGVVDITEELWDATIALNLRSVWLCMKYEIPRMLEQGGGAIVNTSSGAGLIGFADLPAYVASKHGVVGVTKSAALEFAKQNIRVNAVCPGTIRTPMLESYMAGDPAIEKAMNAVSPNGRMGRPEEIAAAVVWLCSDEASFVNGVPFPVDAGAVAQ